MIFSFAPGVVRISCDECDAEPEGVGFITYREAARWARENGWPNKKDTNGEFVTLCPECAEVVKKGNGASYDNR